MDIQLIILYWLVELALWAAAFLFTGTMEKRQPFAGRVAGCSAVYLGVTLVLNRLLITGELEGGVPTRIFWYLLLTGFIWFCWEVSWSVAFYCSLWSFISWQLLYESWILLGQLLRSVVFLSGAADLLGYFILFAVGYSIIALTFARWMAEGRKKIGIRQMSSGLLILGIFELVGIAQRRLDVGAGDSRWELLYLTQILLAVVLYLQNEMFKKSALRQELTTMNLLHKKELEQYRLSRENIELINRKCHDLKHQIRGLRQLGKEEMDGYLAEIEDSIGIYESIVQTGNEVLDTILTEKSLYCNTRQITISCVADGNQMDFMQTVDIYSLLGNALDNAIEAVENLEIPEKRQIDVLIHRQKNFLVIQITNPFQGRLVYDGEWPVTTKEDKCYHGFGMKSMRYVVKKYDGFIRIGEEEGCFDLKILIPLPRVST